MQSSEDCGFVECGSQRIVTQGRATYHEFRGAIILGVEDETVLLQELLLPREVVEQMLRTLVQSEQVGWPLHLDDGEP